MGSCCRPGVNPAEPDWSSPARTPLKCVFTELPNLYDIVKQNRRVGRMQKGLKKQLGKSLGLE